VGSIDAPLADIAAEIRRLHSAPDGANRLVGLLAEQSPVYAGRSTSDAERLRACILAAFESIGTPASAIPFVTEELENGINVQLVAAAAKALRGVTELPRRATALLLDAIERIRGSDDAVRFEQGDHPPATALGELFRTLTWMGPRAAEAEAPLREMLRQQPSPFAASIRAEIEAALAAVSCAPSPAHHCCASEPAPIAMTAPVSTARSEIDVRSIALQDQDGAVTSINDFFSGRPSLLAFFYTRCMNPNKCSLTITRIARLQKLIDAAGMSGRFNVAALSYDPAFDLPDRLRLYGSARGMTFDTRNRLLRTTGAFEPLQRWLDLGVGYGSTTVNQHRSEVFLLDPAGEPNSSIVRQQWDEHLALAALQALLPAAVPASCCR
jgi:cytochrome oxidase Cu insertion factor (SCO1/SenC/PrrC family)